MLSGVVWVGAGGLSDSWVMGGGSVAEYMITAPKTLVDDASLAEVRTAFEDGHVQVVLLVRSGVLRGTLTRGDVPAGVEGAALSFSTLVGRTVGAGESIAVARERLVASGQRRLAVVDAGGRLLGLLCLKRDQTGFCSDEGVAARALERAAEQPGGA